MGRPATCYCMSGVKSMDVDLWKLYRMMFEIRCVEERIKSLWQAGLISGEMHLGTGEEAVIVGVVDHIRDGDALALDHRSTPPLIARGVDPVLIFKELLGQTDGLCAGQGGHMHLMSADHLVASSGIVGSAGPMAAGFSLAGQMLRPNSITVAFFGEGALNQGMLLESLNLAVIWKLPLLFVCKDNRWAITSPSQELTGGSIFDRAHGFGLSCRDVDGLDAEAAWRAAGEEIQRIRSGGGPGFIRARCSRLDGHFLGDPAPVLLRNPGELAKRTGPLIRASLSLRGAGTKERLNSLGGVTRLLRQLAARQEDPVTLLRDRIAGESQRLNVLEREVAEQVEAAAAQALAGEDSR